MSIERIFEDVELKKLRKTSGFLINVDYPTEDVKVHRVSCFYAYPDNPQSVKPSSKTRNNTGEFWFATEQVEAEEKARKIAQQKYDKYGTCRVCYKYTKKS